MFAPPSAIPLTTSALKPLLAIIMVPGCIPEDPNMAPGCIQSYSHSISKTLQKAFHDQCQIYTTSEDIIAVDS
jgi:hypothetical protein